MRDPRTNKSRTQRRERLVRVQQQSPGRELGRPVRQRPPGLLRGIQRGQLVVGQRDLVENAGDVAAQQLKVVFAPRLRVLLVTSRRRIPVGPAPVNCHRGQRNDVKARIVGRSPDGH